MKNPGSISDGHERAFQLLSREEWKELLGFVWQNPELISSDPRLKQAVETCEAIFFLKLGEEQDEAELLSNLEIFYSLHKQKKHILPDDRFKILIREMVGIWKGRDLQQAYERAKNCHDDDLCRSVIEQYEKLPPKRFIHSQSGSVQIVENKNIAPDDGRRSLFKSPQEKEFFDAVREVYPQFIVYPNVAVSTVIDFDNVKDKLTDAEKRYFFSAIIDCVVFDYHDLCMPKYFFELDSSYHDEPAQMKKDEYKNNILSAAGQKLHRIRKTSGTQSHADYKRLIRTLLEEAGK